jgi:hypothetical protein
LLQLEAAVAVVQGIPLFVVFAAFPLLFMYLVAVVAVVGLLITTIVQSLAIEL